jgi:hypothetical protein
MRQSRRSFIDHGYARSEHHRAYWFSMKGSRGGTAGEPVMLTVYLNLPGAVFLSRHVNLRPFASTWQSNSAPPFAMTTPLLGNV